MNNKVLIIIIVLVAVAGYFFMNQGKRGITGVTITGSGTQNIDAGTQSGGVETFQNTGTIENLNVESNGGGHGCKKNVHKNYGILDFNGKKGPMCKKLITTKIKRKKCEKKGVTIKDNLCVMEWETRGGYWRVRLLK